MNRASFPIRSVARRLTGALSDASLTERIKEIHAASDRTYGSRRIHAELRLGHGVRVGRKHVERLMRAAAFSGVRPRKRPRTTIRTAGLRVAPDRPEPDLVSGHHLHLDLEGFLYLAHVQDLFSKLIVGWSMADHLRAEPGRRRARDGLDDVDRHAD